MLVLSRRGGQTIRIGADISITVIRVEGDRVVIGVAAPRSVTVLRGELVEAVRGEVEAAAQATAAVRTLIGS
jgi:carbon storage regulator